jgi:hypothetical protein
MATPTTVPLAQQPLQQPTNATGNNTAPVDSPTGEDEDPGDRKSATLTPTAPQLYYQTHHHVTYREYHVRPSTVTEGRFWVMNVLELVVCMHTSEEAAIRCAEGIECNCGGPGNGRR